jgi:hypothetical protein
MERQQFLGAKVKPEATKLISLVVSGDIRLVLQTAALDATARISS